MRIATWSKPIHVYFGWNTPEGMAKWAKIRDAILNGHFNSDGTPRI